MIQTLRHSVYAILFTVDDSKVDGGPIILARSVRPEELNEEKERTHKLYRARQRILNK